MYQCMCFCGCLIVYMLICVRVYISQHACGAASSQVCGNDFRTHSISISCLSPSCISFSHPTPPLLTRLRPSAIRLSDIQDILGLIPQSVVSKVLECCLSNSFENVCSGPKKKEKLCGWVWEEGVEAVFSFCFPFLPKLFLILSFSVCRTLSFSHLRLLAYFHPQVGASSAGYHCRWLCCRPALYRGL